MLVNGQPAQSTQPAVPLDRRHKNNRGLTQAYDLRDLAAKSALALSDAPPDNLEAQALRAQALRALTTVWTEASEVIRRLRGRPLPGSLRPERKPRAQRARRAPTPSAPAPSAEPAAE